MPEFLYNNAATVVIGVFLLSIIIYIIMFMRKMKKRGPGCCGGNCGTCRCAQDCSMKKKETGDL